MGVKSDFLVWKYSEIEKDQISVLEKQLHLMIIRF